MPDTGDGGDDAADARSADGGREGGSDDPTGDPVALDWGEDGLLPVVAQDADSGEVLMLAYASPTAVDRTRETGRAHYYSRSRDDLWQKGESSGHVQRVRSIRVDCDGDALLYRVDQVEGACHTGHRSCFHRTLDGETVDDPVFDPEEVYGGGD